MTQPVKLIFILALLLGVTFSQAQTTINAIYFGQTHVQKATDAYFGLVGNREALIKVHVVNPTMPVSPVVTATLTVSGLSNLVLTLTGPATLPASIPDGLGVVQHSFANTFTGYIPATYMKTGLQVTVNAGAGVSTTITNMKVSAPTKVILTMTDVQYFSDTSSDYAAGIFEEIEAKWPVADLEVRRLGHVVFPELVIPPRGGARAARIKSKAEYTLQTGLSFDGEQAAALAWNGALKRAAGRSGRWSYYYLNVYNANAGGQAGGFAGVGSGTNEGILQHESGHAMSLPHWGDSGSYPYKGAMHGISAPAIYNATHAGPVWAFDLRTKAFIPPTVQAGNVGGKTVGTYKADPMQGGGSGWQEPAYQLNHFSDYSVNQMRNYLNGHVVVWNPTLNSWAQWNATAGDYTTTVSNDGVQYPTTRDTLVITIMASISGSDPEVTMVYPPIGPYTAGQIRLFDPTVATDRTAAQSIFSPANGSDLCVRVVQGGVQKTYMLAASWVTNQDPYSGGSLVTEAINLPASGGTITKIELLLTPDAQVNGLPANPQVLSTWAPLTPEPSAFEEVPKAFSSSAITMKAVKGSLGFGFSGTVEYLFAETTGTIGASSSGWQTSPSYTDTGLLAGTSYSYTVSMRAGALTSTTSAAASATTLALPATKTVTVGATQQFSLPANLEGFQPVAGLGSFDAGTADKLVVVVSTEDGTNSGTGYVYDVRYNGELMTEAIQEEAGSGNGTAAIFYLDSPGPKGAGTIEVSAEAPNGGIGAAYALSNTLAGVAVTNSRTGTAANSVNLTTAGQNSVVIAVLQNSGNPNSAGTPTADAPLTQVSSGSWGNFWGSHASGYQTVASPSAITPTFSTLTGTSYSINIAAAEFPANPPLPNSWSQTAGGAQSWTTALNWDDGTVPNPTSGTTLDFSSVDILADTTLTLGASRTARIWKFGDFSGTQNWIVSAGNTMTLAGTTPTIEVKTNTTQLDNIVAGTAGLTKTGVGTLDLRGNNTYTGVTRISAGTLQVTNLGIGGSASNIGAAANAVGNLVLNGGTLRYTGPAVSTDRLLSLQTSSSIDASGTGALNLTNTGDLGFNSNTADKTFTLTGTNTGANTMAASIGDNLLTVAVGSEDITTGFTSITKSGAGTWVLSGNNTYTGSTTVSGGILRLSGSAPLGSSSSVAIGGNRLEILTDTALSSIPTFSSQGGTFVLDRATAGAGLTHVFGNASIGNGLTNFSAGSNVTSGSTVIQLASVTNNNGSVATPGLNPTTANLVITGGVTLGVTNAGTANFTLGGTDSVNSIGGDIVNGTRVTGNVIKSGSSVWSLSGNNTYNGTTTINGGTLVYRNLGAKAAGTHTFSGGTTLGLGVATTGSFFTATDVDNAFAGIMTGNLSNVTVAPTTNVGIDTTAGNFTYGTSLSGNPSRGLAKLGANTLTLTGTNTYTGGTRIIAGTLAFSKLPAMPATGAVSVTTGGTLAVNVGGAGEWVTGTSGNGTIGGLLAGLGGQSGSTVTYAGSVVLGINTSNASPTTQTYSGVIANVGTSLGLIKLGTNTLVLDQANTFNGATTISGGTLRLANTAAVQNSSLVSIGANTLQIATSGGITASANVSMNGGAIALNQPSPMPGVTHTFGQLAFAHNTQNFTSSNVTDGNATLTFTSATVRSGSGGTSTLNPAGVNLIIGSFEGGNTGDSTLALGGTSVGNHIDGNIINGMRDGVTGQSLTKSNTSTWTLSGINTYTGNTTIAQGTLRVGATGAIPSGADKGDVVFNTPANTATLDLNGNDVTINGLTQASASTTNRVVNNAVATLKTLTVGGNDATSTFAGILADNTGTGGTLALSKTGTGILTLNGANTYTGNTTVSAGTLVLADNAQLKFMIGVTSGTNNRITNAGTVTLNGDFNIDTTLTDASALNSGSWTIVNAATFNNTFTLIGAGWSETDNVWTKSVGSKNYTFTEATGILQLSTGSSYASWAATNATGTTPDQDQDNDGVSNAVEYLLGGNSLTNDLSKLPTITPSGENMLFSFKRIQSSIHSATAVRIQVGTTLQSWPGNFTVGADTAASSAGVTVLRGVPVGFDTVTLSVPRAPDLQKFIRLQVTITP